jgi:hypothetical protein
MPYNKKRKMKHYVMIIVLILLFLFLCAAEKGIDVFHERYNMGITERDMPEIEGLSCYYSSVSHKLIIEKIK